MSKNKIVHISGVSENGVALAAADVLNEKGTQGIIIVSSEVRAKKLAVDLSFFVHKKIYILPEEEDVFLRYEAKNYDMLFEKIKILKALSQGEECVVVAPASSAIKKNPPHHIFQTSSVSISQGDNVDIEKLKKSLAGIGYERTQIIESRGEFSVRGGIIDVFTADSDNPYRIELFDTEVDSIREFDIETQRSIETLKSIEIFPSELMINDNELFDRAKDKISQEYDNHIEKLKKESKSDELSKRIDQLEVKKNQLVEFLSNSMNIQYMENYISYFYDDTEYLWDYMTSGTIIIDDPDRIDESLAVREKENKHDFEINLERGLAIPKDFENYSNKSDFQKVYKQDNIYICTPFNKSIDMAGRTVESRHAESRQTAVFNGKMDMLETELKRYIKSGFDVTIVCANKERVTNLSDFIERCGLKGKIKTEIGTLTAGIELPREKICYIWDGDIFTTKYNSSKKRKKLTNAQVIKNFSDMQKGDYVVHENHGIGKFLGIKQLVVQDVKKDYLEIKYGGEDVLYVPVEQMDMIQKYVGADSESPKINKLSGGDWKKTKAKAKAAIASMAKELLELSAKRVITKGYAFSEDTVWQKEFEDSFEYEETDDQLRCIDEIKSDMEQEFKMDRLLCGDVGFGKTEVAARAVFKCIADGKQAAILVPTTILANQHYYTLSKRFEKFPFKVEMLSRFRTEKQQEKIIKELEAGSIDVIIGTHRMLSEDVKFKDLGLLVIDEEQRFGVLHKEKIKRLKESVDILTLSATPIPRTLHMSLSGMRDMSIISEPPDERYPVQTYVLEQENDVIREVIERELGRGGQVFVVYNRVRGIHRIANQIKELVPEAEISIGHGQMSERVLEDVMHEFINGETNVLVSTTIIESGIDIPNVNTMIILDCDNFGLSQLYQLRGRVGRSNRMAYAYFMYQKDKTLTETAEKRLRAIKEFTEFGSGFKVAMKDLEIRGAGNLLGMQQHGHMMMIGYELYCKLVDDAVKALGGEIVNPDTEDSSVEFEVSAYIPEKYIADEVLRLQMYKKIASIGSKNDEIEVVDEFIDRFGELPKETYDLIKISRIRKTAEDMGITRIHEYAGKIIFDFAPRNKLNAKALAGLSEKYGSRVFIHGGAKPFMKLTYDKKAGKIEETTGFLETLTIDALGGSA